MSYHDLDKVNIKTSNITTINNRNDLESYIKCVMDGDDYGLGAVEAAQATANKVVQVLANLLINLLDNKIISEEELKNICKYIF